MGRKLGQHFLHQRAILARIADAVAAGSPGVVIEIGPGRGALTAFLLERAPRVIAIEVDAQLVRSLRERFADASHLSVVEADVLSIDLAQWGSATITGNLPYYITSPILERVLSLGRTLRQAVFLVQEEVADRLVAQPGSREYGFLTVRTRMVADAEKLFRVPPAAFRPPPKVHSALVRLTPHTPVAAPGLVEFVARCFRHKRKTLRNNLTGAYPSHQVDTLPEASLRAEQLSLDEFRYLHQRLGPPRA